MNTLSRQFCPDLRSARLPLYAAMAATFMLFVAASPVRAASFITEVKLIGGPRTRRTR